MAKQTLLEAGRIVNTHGIQGEVKIVPWCDTPQFLCGFSTLYLDGKPVEVLSSRVHKGNVLARLAGYSTVNDAMLLKNKVVFIHRKDAALPEGHFFLADLIGARVLDADSGEELGTLAEVLSPAGQQIYVVRGKREILIPAVEQFVVETNVDQGYIRVRLIEGL